MGYQPQMHYSHNYASDQSFTVLADADQILRVREPAPHAFHGRIRAHSEQWVCSLIRAGDTAGQLRYHFL